MARPLAIDGYCGQGGASWGLYLAGFDVIGIDKRRQPRHPAFHKAEYAKHFRFVEADFLEYVIEKSASFIHASPPCQKFTALRHMPTHRKDHPDLISATREKLAASGIPWSIENVLEAPLGASGHLIVLCGTMFGLQTANGAAELRRHRLFETSFSIPLRPACQHGQTPLGVYGGHVRDRCRRVLTVVGYTPVDNGGRGKGARRSISITGHTAQTNLDRNRVRQTFTNQQAREAMQAPWMSMAGLSQAIPPVYMQFIAKQFLESEAHGGRTDPHHPAVENGRDNS